MTLRATTRSSGTGRAAGLVLALAMVAAGLLPAQARASDVLQIKVLSSRADLISGGDALVEVVPPDGVPPLGLTVDIDGRDVSSAFVLRQSGPMAGRIVGHVAGLAVGPNVLTARLAKRYSARITITNHPIGGPVFSGHQVQPWICSTDGAGLGAAQDEQCNAPTRYTFQYKNAVTGQFAAYDPNAPPPPSQIAVTVTDQGRVVPYIVRIERGTMNRGIHDIAVLFNPTEPWEGPWAPQGGWNHKLLVPFGASCEPGHRQGSPDSVLDDQALSRGFMVLTSSMNVLGQHCNDVTSAETLMMLKEHVVETYGEIRYTIGNGCSGGSIQQHHIAADYPGLLDGIQPACSFPDIWTTYQEMGDSALFARYFDETSPHLWAVEEQRAAATGHASMGTYEFMGRLRAPTYLDPTAGGDCAGFDWTYDPETNPDGERCTIQDYQVAVWGRRPQDGFANRPYDNVGVQYGLAALESGLILPEQFIDLNEKVGGWDIDKVWQPRRSEADPVALPIAYRSGRVTSGRELAKVPILDLRGTSNFEEHYDWRTHVLRARLLRDNGHADNHVSWNSPCPLLPCPPIATEAFLLMDRWLAAIEADTSGDPLEVRVVRNKPAVAVDACWIDGRKITDQALCNLLLPYFRDPRFVAGGPATFDVLKCQLRSLDRADYTVTFSDDQWARLQNTFPTGVCDYRKAGVGQQLSMPWMTFADGPGGQPLGPAPVSVPVKR